MKSLSTLILTSMFLTSGLAYAADKDDKNDDHPDVVKTAPDLIVDAKPLLDFSAMGDNVPGGFGLGLGAERRVGEKWYLTAEATGWTLDRSADNVKDLQKDADDDELIAKKRRAAALLFGGRYYGHPTADSWYAGGKSGFMRSKSTYVVDDAEIQDEARGIPLLFEGGYRWVWESGLIVRVGGRGGQTLLFQRDVSTKKGIESDASERKVKDEDPEFSPSFEVAIGKVL